MARMSTTDFEFRVVWPFKAVYRVRYVDGEYSLTVIGLRTLLETQGYAVAALRRAPQRTPS